MPPIDRSTLTPLELAVWAASFVHNNDSMPVADAVVVQLRKELAREVAAESQASVDQRHVMRISGSTIIGCSCGYRPPPKYNTTDADADELMALHLTHVRASLPAALVHKRCPFCEGIGEHTDDRCPHANGPSSSGRIF